MSYPVEIHFLPADKTSRVLAGTNLFAAAHRVGVHIDSVCGGRGTCGRCRVHMEGSNLGISVVDRNHLSPQDLANGWRLACASPVHEDTICLTPEVLEIPQTAVTGEGHRVGLEPGIRKVYLDLDRPSESDTRSDQERLTDALESRGFAALIDLNLMRRLPTILRAADFKVTAAITGQDLISIEPGDTRDCLFGVAFDLGTTTIVGSLLDLTTGDTVGVESALNRQGLFGGDVISRIAYTMPGIKHRQDMQQAVVETMNRILARLAAAGGLESDHLYAAVVVGNCTMLHLLLGVEARPIAVAPFVPVFKVSVEVKARDIGLDIYPQTRVETVPCVGAYVGADTVAGLHATRIARQDDLWLFIDVGTNSEIALGSSQGIAATAAPAGPAFEGSCIRAGMAATTGAIERVVLTEEVEVGVVGGGIAQGICGSGLIDAVAQLRQSGLVDESGRLSARSDKPNHPLADRLTERNGERAFALTDDVWLMQRDIRELQSAKSSVATGITVLMERLGVGLEDIDAVLLAGSFGSKIDPRNAREIGLVPELPLDRIRCVGNVAAEGAKMILLSFRERRVADDLACQIEYVELSSRPDFNDLFVEGLSFPSQPMGEP